MKLKGRYAIITGASQGLGAAIAEAYINEGASVLACARNAQPLQALIARLSGRLTPGQTITAHRCDVGDPAQIDELVDIARRIFPHVDILVNNAGVYGPMGTIEEVDWSEWVSAIHINLLGTVYPCRALMPHFKQRGYGKIVNLSGGGATNPMPRVSAYAASKAAVVRFTETLAEEVKPFRIDINAVAPGALATRLTDQLIEAGPEKVGGAFHARMMKIRDEGGTPLIKGAEACVYLASAESDGITGKLISAIWDPWPDLQRHAADLAGTDIYTLRRIVPADRGKNWENS